VKPILFMVIICAAAALAGCTDASSTSATRFSQTGELVALSGADAGAEFACIACHGLNGAGDGAGSPRLAGLDAGYLERQLSDYADSRRQHPQMQWISRRLNAGQRRAVAEYYAALPWTAEDGRQQAMMRLYHHGDPARGIQPCAACHGQNGEGIGAANPPLAGQPAGFIAEQLALWRKSKRRNDPGDEMLRISQLLTPSEIRQVAIYSANLSGAVLNPATLEAFLSERRDGPRNDASGPPLHVPESARTAE
jgi:cytochrome c553